MLLELGNADPVLKEGDTPRTGWCVTYVDIPDNPDSFDEGHHAYQQIIDPTFDGQALKDHLSEALLFGDGRVTSLPGQEPVIAVASPFGIWQAHAKMGSKPKWINLVDGDEKAQETVRILADYYGCPIGRPVGFEDTHYTWNGPPGVGPDPFGGASMNITINGRDMQARMFGGGVQDSGVSTTAPTSTTYTLDGKTAPGSTSAYSGQRILAGSTAVGDVYGIAQSNTNASPPVVTVDRWYNAATPGGSAATTPVAGPWIIPDGPTAVRFMGLSASTTTLAAPSTNTSLPGEITTAGGGLVRQVCPWAHTASAATTTLTPVYTANGSDSLPVVLGSVGTFSSMVVAATTQTIFFNTLFSATATLSSIGDQLTVTQTITGT
jgi:hypothetical protein